MLLQARADVTVKAGKTYSNRYYHEARGKGTPVAAGPTLAGELEKIELLAEAGFDFKSTNDYGTNCLWLALASPTKSQDRDQRGKMIQRMFDLKADLHNRLKKSNGSTHSPTGQANPRWGWSFLDYHDCEIQQWLSCIHPNEQGLRFVLAHGGDPNARLGRGVPLIAIYYIVDPELGLSGDTTCLELLLDAKVDLNEKSIEGIYTTMWLFAYIRGSQQALLLFVNRKGSLEKPAGSWFQGDFYHEAKKAGNTDSMNFYEDWMAMQQDQEATVEVSCRPSDGSIGLERSLALEI